MEKQFRKDGDSVPHKHSIYDTDNHFVVDTITRAITTECPKTKLMRYDHNSERLTFEVPRYIEGFDLSICNKITIDFVNSSKDGYYSSIGTYDVVDMQISPDGNDVIIFSWLISNESTQYAGRLSFGLSFVSASGSTVNYAWHTDTYSNIMVCEGVYNGNNLF